MPSYFSPGQKRPYSKTMALAAAGVSRDHHSAYERFASGGNEKLMRKDGEKNIWLNSIDPKVGHQAKGKAMTIEGDPGLSRQEAFEEAVKDPMILYAAREAGIRRLNSAADLDKAMRWQLKNQGRDKKEDTEVAVDPQKSQQALSMSQQWQAQNPSSETASSGAAGSESGSYAASPSASVIAQDSEGVRSDPYFASSSSGGSSVARRSYEDLLSGGSNHRAALYDSLSEMGREKAESYRAITNDYAQRARTSASEIARATLDASSSLSSKVRKTVNNMNYLNPWTTKMRGKGGGKTIAQLTQEMMGLDFG